MAGDWIKFEKATLDKPEVFRIATDLSIDPDAVIGKLLRVWNWFDDQSEDGNASVTVSALLDRYAGVTGFTKAMEKVGWLIIEADLMHLPNFDRHNGKTAKNRCNTNRRVAKSRSMKQKSNAESVTNVTSKPLQKPLPEKRREEKSILPKGNITPLPPQGDVFKIQINKLFNRRESTKWSEKEIRAFNKIKIEQDDMDLLAKYYNPRTGSPYRRRDVQTLLNNWQGELDRARGWTPNTISTTDDNGVTHVGGRSGTIINAQEQPELTAQELKELEESGI